MNPRFAMSLLTELEGLKGPTGYKYFAPSGADGHPLFGLVWRDGALIERRQVTGFCRIGAQFE